MKQPPRSLYNTFDFCQQRKERNSEAKFHCGKCKIIEMRRIYSIDTHHISCDGRKKTFHHISLAKTNINSIPPVKLTTHHITNNKPTTNN